MILRPGLSLEGALNAVSTSQNMDVTVDYLDYNVQGMPTVPATFVTTTLGTTTVTFLPAPTSGPAREPVRISIYNADSAAKTLTLRTKDAGTSTTKVILNVSTSTLKSLLWEKGTQWQFNV